MYATALGHIVAHEKIQVLLVDKLSLPRIKRILWRKDEQLAQSLHDESHPLSFLDVLDPVFSLF